MNKTAKIGIKHILRFGVVAILVLVAPLTLAAEREAPWVGESLDGVLCTGDSVRNYGPFDYRTRKDKLPVVENRHFTPKVEQLKGGETTKYAIGDIKYTLVIFPNHHRALYSAVRFSLGEADGGQQRTYPAECFLQRAMHFSPEDPVPYILYALYLHRSDRLDQALAMYRSAEEMAPQDGNLLYNFGLLLFDTGDYEQSREYAQRAYDSGVTLPGLKRKLKSVGHWE